MTVRFTDTATSDLDEIFARVGVDNPVAAAGIALAIKGAVARLQLFPRIGAETDQPGIYIKIVRPYRYLIFYWIDRNTVVIRNVRHPARQRPSERS